MPFIVSDIHDPVALAAVCRQCNLPEPREGCLHLEAREVSGWIVRLPEVRSPIVCDTLSGRIAYHPRDNAFTSFRSILRFVHRYYHVRHRMRQDSGRSACSAHAVHRLHRRTLASVG